MLHLFLIETFILHFLIFSVKPQVENVFSSLEVCKYNESMFSLPRDDPHQSLTNGKFPFESDWLMRILIKKKFLVVGCGKRGNDNIVTCVTMMTRILSQV